MAGWNHVHITGASGSGTTTLGRALAAALGARHLDTDDFFWLPTDPPYQNQRPHDERLRLLWEEFERAPRWVLSGSLSGWGDPLIGRFDLVIFLEAPTATRLSRLAERERTRFGAAALAPGGAMHENHRDFLQWASGYDPGTVGRNRAMHEKWLATLPCPVLRLYGLTPTREQVQRTMAFHDTR
jgi:adenylate kinase family enzyme